MTNNIKIGLGAFLVILILFLLIKGCKANIA